MGVVRDAVIAWMYEKRCYNPVSKDIFWSLLVVAETYEGCLSDINGFHIKRDHVFAALDGASGGPVTEGNMEGGTGMICHGFKGGVGTSSREINIDESLCTVGVLVQANYGSRRNLIIASVPVGEVEGQTPIYHSEEGDSSSIIVIAATNAPLLPPQLKQLARRTPLDIARVGE